MSKWLVGISVLVFSLVLGISYLKVVAFDRSKEEPPDIKSLVPPPPETNFYTHLSPWESPFNPHDVFRYWPILAHDTMLLPNDMPVVMVLVGNPKIDWFLMESKKILPSQVGLPKGELAVTVMFVFTIDGSKMLGYMAYDNEGPVRVYVWVTEERKYKYMVNKGQLDT